MSKQLQCQLLRGHDIGWTDYKIFSVISTIDQRQGVFADLRRGLSTPPNEAVRIILRARSAVSGSDFGC